jgi:hypothetical protein
MLIKLMRRTQAEPAHIETANTGCSPAPSPTSRRIGWRPRPTPGDQHAIEQGSAPLIAEHFHLPVELGDIRAPVLPACLEIAPIRLERWRGKPAGAWPLRWTVAWRICRLQEAAHGHPAHTHVLGDPPYRCACCAPLAHRLPSCDAPRSRFQFAQFRSARRWRRERWHHRGFGFGLHFRDDVLHVSTATAKNLVECGAGVGRQVKPIGDLDPLLRTRPWRRVTTASPRS